MLLVPSDTDVDGDGYTCLGLQEIWAELIKAQAEGRKDSEKFYGEVFDECAAIAEGCRLAA